jgi:flagellar L-ring protein FlgH
MSKPSWFPFKQWRARLAAGVPLLAFALPLCGQSLWKEDASPSLVADRRAARVGDVVTILVQELNTATKDNSTKTGKSTSLDAKIDAFFYSPAASGLLTHNGRMPAIKLGSKHDFEGGGKINNTERVTARIACRVIDVLPNGNLVIEGSREITFGGETQQATLKGVIRSDDVMPNNTVFSYHIAEAAIKYTSKGTVTNAQKKGWFTRFWEKITPF